METTHGARPHEVTAALRQAVQTVSLIHELAAVLRAALPVVEDAETDSRHRCTPQWKEVASRFREQAQTIRTLLTKAETQFPGSVENTTETPAQIASESRKWRVVHPDEILEEGDEWTGDDKKWTEIYKRWHGEKASSCGALSVRRRVKETEQCPHCEGRKKINVTPGRLGSGSPCICVLQEIRAEYPPIINTKVEPEPQYRDLGPEDVLQEGDEHFRQDGTWHKIAVTAIGYPLACSSARYRRPLPAPVAESADVPPAGMKLLADEHKKGQWVEGAMWWDDSEWTRNSGRTGCWADGIVAVPLNWQPEHPAPVEQKPAWTLPDPPAGHTWHRTDWTEDMLPEGYRPLLAGETGSYEYNLFAGGWEFVDESDEMARVPVPVSPSNSSSWLRTNRPLPAPVQPPQLPSDIMGCLHLIIQLLTDKSK